MAIKGTLLADFTSFYDAVNKAEVELKSFASGAGQVEKSLAGMVDSFSGRKLIQDATLMAQAVEDIGGVSKLTEKELARVSSTAKDAADKLRAMGKDVPPGLQKIADAATTTARRFDAMATAVGTFIGNFAYNVVQQGIRSIVQLGLDAFATAGQIDDMSKKLGISAEAVQGFSFAAEQSGTTLEAFGTAITRLNVNLATGSDSTVKALKAVGLELTTLRTMRPEEAFLAITDVLAKIPDTMQQVRIGTELMGRGFAEILPAIVDGLRQMSEGADKMSNETVRRLAAAEDAWAALGRKVTIVSGEMIAGMMKNLDELERQWGESGRFERILKFGPLATLLNLAEHFGLVGKAATETGQEFTEVVIPAFEKVSTAQAGLAAAVDRATRDTEDYGHRLLLAIARQQEAMEEYIRDEIASLSFLSAAFNVSQRQMLATMDQVSAAADAMPLPKLWEAMMTARAPEIESQAVSAGRTIGRSFAAGFIEDVSWDISQNLTDALVGLQSFQEGFIGIWRSIQFGVSRILSDMLQGFVQRFLGGMLGAMQGQQGAFSNAFQGMFGGGGGGGFLGFLLGGGIMAGIGALLGGITRLFGGGKDQRPGVYATLPSMPIVRGEGLRRDAQWNVTLQPGAIAIDGADKSPKEIAREIAPAMVDVILRENPDGSRTRLRRGLVMPANQVA